MIDVGLMTAELSSDQFARISRMLYDLCGINLSVGKEGLVKARLMKRLRVLGLSDFDAYLHYVQNNPQSQELTTMVDALTTNKTDFFRENEHFEFLRSRILPAFRTKSGGMRIWSAGCSSGEEPYSIAILLKEEWPGIERCDVRILATDISTKILAKAREGIYAEDTVRDVPQLGLGKYFLCSGRHPNRTYSVREDLKSMIRFARLNLMDEWPMKGPFDVIFCRNVMIYFDKPTQQQLVKRFWNLLQPGGFLFVGHSESLTTSSREFRYVQPATYQK